VIIACDFSSIGITIRVNESLLNEYSKYRWKKPMLRCGLNKDENDIIINFDYKTWKLILSKACLSKNKYKIISNIFNLEFMIYQCVWFSSV
jgi:hypothetical protein